MENKIDIPNNEIWYTSKSGQVIVPNPKTAFKARIVSNTYLNGKGIIKFDCDVIRIGSGAFCNSDLTSILIPDSVIEVGAGAFFNTKFLNNFIRFKRLTREDDAIIAYKRFSTCYGCTERLHCNKSVNRDNIDEMNMSDVYAYLLPADCMADGYNLHLDVYKIKAKGISDYWYDSVSMICGKRINVLEKILWGDLEKITAEILKEYIKNQKL